MAMAWHGTHHPLAPRPSPLARSLTYHLFPLYNNNNNNKPSGVFDALQRGFLKAVVFGISVPEPSSKRRKTFKTIETYQWKVCVCVWCDGARLAVEATFCPSPTLFLVTCPSPTLFLLTHTHCNMPPHHPQPHRSATRTPATS